ncbi:choice-of-anchor A family protein [Glycomyces salinus]|uniref:choice-of-anchor A family protein n=1 Tax=Glycomyces salinus TaxID=980294 RepID=UPI0018ECB241|nr:choice-of-anchor A family protein [Glycomyces salinus]
MKKQAAAMTARHRRLAARAGIVGAAVGATAIAVAASMMNSQALAQEVTVDPLSPALGFNAFIEGDTVLTESEMEGPLATGGDLAVQGPYRIDIHSRATFYDGDDTNPSSLVVGGSVDWEQSTSAGTAQVLNSNGYAKVGDLTGTDVETTDANGASQPTRLVPSGAGYDSAPRVELTVRQPADTVESSPIDFATAFSEMKADAELLAGCANTVTMFDSREGGSEVAKGEVEPGRQIFITLTEGETNVLNVTGDDLNNMSDLTFVNKPTADTPILINVDTSSTDGVLDWDVASQAGVSGVDAPYILWNFGDTAELTLVGGDTVEGSVYTPNADFTDLSISNVEGQIVAANAVLGTTAASSGEVHHFPFAAELSCETEVDPTPSESPTSDGPTSDDPTSDGPTSDGPTSDGPTSDGPTSDGPTSEGPTSDGPTSDGTTGTDAAGGSHYSTRGLPITGTSLVVPAIVAGALLTVGAVVMFAARRRRNLD